MHRIPSVAMQAFAREIFVAAGSNADEASIIADHLVEASLMGHDSHGVIRISKYVDWVRAGQVVATRHIQIDKDKGALLVVDGGFGYGQVIGKEAMELGPTRMAWLHSPFAIPGISVVSGLGPNSWPSGDWHRCIS